MAGRQNVIVDLATLPKVPSVVVAKKLLVRDVFPPRIQNGVARVIHPIKNKNLNRDARIRKIAKKGASWLTLGDACKFGERLILECSRGCIGTKSMGELKKVLMHYGLQLGR